MQATHVNDHAHGHDALQASRQVGIRVGEERHGEGIDFKARCSPSGSGCLSHV